MRVRVCGVGVRVRVCGVGVRVRVCALLAIMHAEYSMPIYVGECEVRECAPATRGSLE